MCFPRWTSRMRRVSFLGFMALVAAGLASAQSITAFDQPEPSGSSSSQAGLSASGLQLAEFSLPEIPDPSPAAPASAASGAGQYGGQGAGAAKTNFLHNWTFEAGGGFNAPIGNDIPFITWGGNVNLGAGFRFSNRLSALLEYQFIDDKLPGAMLAAYGVSAGNAHINSITGSPVIDLFPKKSTGVYLVGGFGYYHKSTNLQDYEEVESFYGVYEEPVTVASVTSNQWGANAGLGIYHKLGGNLYGGDSTHTELFGEARYTFLHTPPPSASNGFGTTELIPVTLGLRF